MISKGRKWSWETPPPPIPSTEIKRIVTADVVVIGAGLAGMVATLAAQEAGATPILIEKNGTFSARGYHNTAFGSKLQGKLGININYRKVVRDWIAWAQGRLNEDLLWLFAKKSGACMDWLIDIAEAGGMSVGIWDGYYKGPEYTEYPVCHLFYVPNKPIDSWNYNLGKILEKTIIDRGIQIHYNMPVARLIKEGDGPVTGLYAGTPGDYTQYNANSVIITTGDYSGNSEMLERYNPFALQVDAQLYFPQSSNLGEGHKLAMWVGGVM